ncbi:MAG: tetratricopeptide repeat protein [Crocinitomicaceae bacterium]|nr:tetratricopeptide repeat protein [Crocinitomicaceae bacterium]
MSGIKVSLGLLLVTGFFFASCGEGNKEEVKESNVSLNDQLEATPDSIPLIVERGRLMFEAYAYEKAMADAAHAFRLDSNRFDVRHLYADALNNRAGRSIADVSSAQYHYSKLLVEKPEELSVLIGLASTYSYQQDFESSFKYINEALRIDQRYRDAYILKGSNYGALGNRDLMKSSYETAVQQDPEFFEAYIRLGALYLEDNDKICIEYFTTAYQLEPENLEALYSVAYAKQHYGQVDEARALYRKMATDTVDFYVSQALFQLGHIQQFVNQDLDSAIYFYKSATYTEPRYVEAYHNIGMCYDLKGDKTRALQNFGKALKYNPEFALSRAYADSIR